MSRNNSTTKNKRTNKHSSSKGRRSASDLRDQERAQLRNKPKTDSSGCFRARFPGPEAMGGEEAGSSQFAVAPPGGGSFEEETPRMWVSNGEL
jgi:hypothetical protein